MFDLILGTAREDERIRAVILDGSRADPNSPRDELQDYDIIYVVTDPEPFRHNMEWIKRFGEMMILQLPNEMQNPPPDELNYPAYLMQFMDGTRIDLTIMPQSLHVPRQEWFNANRILESVLQSDSANNNINVLKATNAFPKGIKMNHYFTSPHAWFIRTNCPSGMQWFWRDRPMFDQDNDFDTKNAKASAYMRCSAGCTDPRGIFGSNGP